MIVLLLGSISGVISEAWQYVTSSVGSGVEGLRSSAEAIREAFGIDYETIRTYQDIAEEAKSAWERLNELPDFYRVNRNFALETDFDFRRDYVMHMKVHAFDLNTGEYIDQWITVESDEALTKQQWFDLGREATFDTPFGTDLVLEYATEFQYYVKA